METSKLFSLPLLLLLVVFCYVLCLEAVTEPRDAAALQSLKSQLKNLPPSWQMTNDPCGSHWDGVTCNISNVIALGLSTLGLEGTLGDAIGELSELRSLDLSFNKGLTGPLTPRIGDLKKLNILILDGCSFTDTIPNEIGTLSDLTFLALHCNNFSGTIPPSLGNLSKLYWMDLANNQLTGPIPVSTATTPGLDQLVAAKHFLLNMNQLTGSLPSELFGSEMVLTHLLLDGNHLTGEIPSTLGLVKNLGVLRLDRNSFTGPVPSSISNLTNLNELHLANNLLTGPVPDLTGMNFLNYVDLSNNSFDPSEAPEWFSTTKSLTVIVMEYGNLQGPVPQHLFSLPQLQQVKLRNNQFNGTLDMGNNVTQQLQLVDFEDNRISSFRLITGYTNTLILKGNPVCTSAMSNSSYCQDQQQEAYSTSITKCNSKTCTTSGQKLNPQSCECAYPYEGTLYFRAPSFRDLSNATVFNSLEVSLWVKLGLKPGFVSLQNIFFNADDYLQVHSKLFPSGKNFSETDIQKIRFGLSNQNFTAPPEFGPYYFNESPSNGLYPRH